MTEEPAVYYTATDRRSWMRIAIGLSVLLGFLLASAWVGWVMVGCPANCSPLHWWHQPADVLYLA